MSMAIQQLGANARAAGRSIFDNPYLKTSALPASTGEPLATWQAKYDAWELGWRAEDLIRAGQPSLGHSISTNPPK